MIHTHIHKPSNTWFTLDECETCGAEIQAANAVSVAPSDYNKLIKCGVALVVELPGEGWFDEDTGMEVCESCE